MREQYATSGPGKLQGEPPMARYLYELMLDGTQDDVASDGMGGASCTRFGRRTLVEDEQGFVWYRRHPNVADAETYLESFYVDEGEA